jgi:hypothetical protein
MPGGPPGKNDHKIFASTLGQIGPSLSNRGPENSQRVAPKSRNWSNLDSFFCRHGWGKIFVTFFTCHSPENVFEPLF